MPRGISKRELERSGFTDHGDYQMCGPCERGIHHGPTMLTLDNGRRVDAMGTCSCGCHDY